ncbi:BON domain-containing protein [Janthinobacterium fluminis]|uniref:BON domain-containing protein n=1 Tax=Janthinobacterium fluminis TaxID=2987524 RepID=A0ABT5K2R6_9BURK|nr:BON domain-containing protein [Janthinobacterium fluminis]MDC8759021.1 BON domain-containing protein [Janthinobacterium fluminis]
MNKFTLLALSGVASLVFSAGQAMADETGGASYKSLKDRAATEYKSAVARCGSETGKARKICKQEAKVARAKADVDAVAQYRNTERDLSRARVAVANAEYDLAKAKCAERSRAERSACLNEAKSVQVAAANAAKSAPQTAGASGAAGSTGAGAAQQERHAGTTPAHENCEAMNASDKAACLTRRTAGSAKAAIADTVITTKVKADLVKAPDLKAMDVHVETVNGVVMLSGFVPSQAEAKKAEDLARSVEGVTDVKSALKVK